MNAAGRYLLNAADFRESRNVRTSGRRTNCCAKRVANGGGMFRSDALFLMDVTSGAKMHPAGRGGPSLTFSRLETKQLELGGLRPWGEILPSLRLDGATSKPTLGSSVGSTQSVPPDLPAGRRSDPPTHTARTSTTLGDALDGEKGDP